MASKQHGIRVCEAQPFAARQSRFWFHEFGFSMFWCLKQIFNLILCAFEFRRFPRNDAADRKKNTST